jgi:hypothetical protein
MSSYDVCNMKHDIIFYPYVIFFFFLTNTDNLINRKTKMILYRDLGTTSSLVTILQILSRISSKQIEFKTSLDAAFASVWAAEFASRFTSDIIRSKAAQFLLNPFYEMSTITIRGKYRINLLNYLQSITFKNNIEKTHLFTEQHCC